MSGLSENEVDEFFNAARDLSDLDYELRRLTAAFKETGNEALAAKLHKASVTIYESSEKMRSLFVRSN